MYYRWKIQFLRSPWGRRAWWRLGKGRHRQAGSGYEDIIGELVAGKTFADIGCMWGVNGKYAFLAERSGAVRVVGVDVATATAEFLEELERTKSSVEFVQGDATSRDVMEKVGHVDIVFCAGVLYHHPSPYEFVLVLRELCGERLILSTATIPEVKGLPQAAIYYPMLPDTDRGVWDLRHWGSTRQYAITQPYAPEVGYSNWFWGMTPSCVHALLETGGFRVERVIQQSPWGHMFVCGVGAKPVAELRGSHISA